MVTYKDERFLASRKGNPSSFCSTIMAGERVFTREEGHIDLREFRQDEKTRRRTSCNMRKGRKKKEMLDRSILELLIHSILLGFVSASPAPGAMGRCELRSKKLSGL